MRIKLLLPMLLCCLSTAFAKNSLQVFPAPQGADLIDDFTVKVRQNSPEWKPIDTYLIKVDEVKGTKHSVKDASMAYFNFSGSVEVCVEYNKGTINSARIRPLSFDINHRIDGNKVYFSLSHPCNLSVEVNGDIFHNLHLFANPMETEIPKAKDKNVIFFGPGLHTPQDGTKFNIPSNSTVYISGGALLKGQIAIDNAQNVRVIGRGMVDYRTKMGILISNSKNVYVEGITATQCATGGSSDVTIKNVKAISYYGWGDGMNVFASNNVSFDGVFCRNSDDCTTVYATRKGFSGGCSNISMTNSTLWADVAHPIFIGLHGNSEMPDTIQNVTYRNIDILDHNEKQVDYQGCLAINGGDNNVIRNITFDNIRIEDFRKGQLINLRIFFNKKYCKAPGSIIENILFKDISYTGRNANLSIIEGYDDERMVKNVRFENLKINGQYIFDSMPNKPAWYKTSDMADFYVGSHTENIVFSKTSEEHTH